MLDLIKRMKILEGTSISILNAPTEYVNNIQNRVKNVLVESKLEKKSDQFHLFVKSKKELEKFLSRLEKIIKPNAMLWMCFPKQSSLIETDLNRDIVWKILSETKYHQITLVSIDETWSAFGFRNEEKILKKNLPSEPNKYVDKEKRLVKLPEDLSILLSKNKIAKQTFEKLSFSNQKEYVLWIVEAKKEETKEARLKGTIKKLIEGKKNPSEK